MPVTDFIKDHITLCFSYIAVIFFTNNAENQIFAHRECSFNARKVKL